MGDGPDGCTTVEEWLAAGGTITRERADGEPVLVEFRGTTFEFLPDRTTSAQWRCRRTGVYGHQRAHLTLRIEPYVCRYERCRLYGRHQHNGRFWCDEHRDGPDSQGEQTNDKQAEPV